MKSLIAWIKEVKATIQPYQVSVLIISFIAMLTANGLVMALPIILLDPTLICFDNSNGLEGPGFECSMREACSGEYTYVIDQTESINSFTNEFNLICDDGYLSDLVGSFAFFGKMLGYFFYTYYIDTSKPLVRPLMNTILACGITGMLALVCFDPRLYYVIMFLFNFFNSGIITLCYSHTVEVCQKNKELKESCVQLIYVGWALSSCYSAAFAQISSDWRILTSIVSSLPLIIVYFWYYNLESHYYEFLKDVQHLKADTAYDEKEYVKEHPKAGHFINLLKFKSLRMMTIMTCLIESILGIVYYGAHLAVDSLVGNIYINMSLLGIMEAIGYLTSAVVNTQYKRRESHYVFLFLNFLVYILFLFCYTEHKSESTYELLVANAVLALAGKWLNTVLYGMFHGYLAELAPNNYRPAIFSFTGAVSAVFFIIIPQIITAMQMLGFSSYVAFGISNLLGILFVCPLEETKGKVPKEVADEELTDQIELAKPDAQAQTPSTV